MAILAYIFSPIIIKILAKGFEGDQFDAAVRLNRIGLPIVVFLGITYVFSGYLQSNQVFGPHAIMGIPYNFVFLIYLLFLVKGGDITNLMVVSVIAASTQFLIQLPAVRHSGYRYSLSFDFRDPYLSKAMILVLPVLLGSAVRQINVVIDKTLASELVDGSISALTYSSRINEMIIAVFVMAITTVVFPMLSKAFSEGDTTQVRKIFNEGVNIILLITVPATIGIMLAEPVVRIFFERNAFDELATAMTAALFYYSVGLIGLPSGSCSIRSSILPRYQDPMVNGTIAVVLNVVLNLLFIRFMGHNGLALATSISAIFTSVLLMVDLRKKMGPIGMKGILITFAKTLVAATIMGLIVYIIFFKLGALIISNKLVELIFLLLSIGIGVAVYFGLCLLLRVKEVSRFFKFNR